MFMVVSVMIFLRLICLFGCIMYFSNAQLQLDGIEGMNTRKLLAVDHDSTDDCGKPLRPTEKVVSCHKAFYAKAFKSTCKSYPSPPSDIKHSFHFDKTSKELYLNVTWEEPKYGQSTLWGYDVLLCDDHYRSQRCFQINGKESNDRNFTFDKIKFGIPYLIIISTLPRGDGKMTNSLEHKVKSPDQCEVYAKENLELPVLCHKVHNLRVDQQCNATGVASISWDKPMVGHDHVLIEVFSSCSRDVMDLVDQENATSVWLTGLKNGCKYFVRIQLLKLHKRIRENSKQENLTFSCKDIAKPLPQTISKNQQSYKEHSSRYVIKVVIYVVPSSFFVVLTISTALFLAFRRRKRRLKKNFQKLRSQDQKSSALKTELAEECPAVEDNDKVKVMIVHSSGCKDVNNFVLLFANLLNVNGIIVRLDLLENARINQIGAARYFEETEKESDYVIIVCTDDLEISNSEFNRPAMFILNIIKNNIMNSGNLSKYIPVYLDDLRLVPASLQGIAKKVPDEAKSVIERLHNITRYQLTSLEHQGPIKNEISIDSRLLKNLKLAAANVNEKSHARCDINSCSKGLILSSVTDSFADLIID